MSRKKKPYDRTVFRSIALIMQFGINMLVPICLMSAVGVWMDKHFGTNFWMILLFCMQRPNVLSFGDLAIQRGMRMIYHHRKIDRKLFEKYRRRLSPYCSVASLYFWAAAGGAVPGLKDHAPKSGADCKKKAGIR